MTRGGVGTQILDDDSDDDGISDGDEILVYDASDPDPALHGYGDPCTNGSRPIFIDGFESGNTAAWSGSGQCGSL